MKTARLRLMLVQLTLGLVLGPIVSMSHAENRFKLSPSTAARGLQRSQGSSSSSSGGSQSSFKTMPKLTMPRVTGSPTFTATPSGGVSTQIKSFPGFNGGTIGKSPIAVKPNFPINFGGVTSTGGSGGKFDVVKPGTIGTFPGGTFGKGKDPILKPTFPIDIGVVGSGKGDKPIFVKPTFPIDIGVIDKPILVPKFPIIPIDPGIGNGNPGGNPGNPGGNPGCNPGGGNCPTKPCDPCDHWFGWPWPIGIPVGVPVGGLPPITIIGGGGGGGGGTTIINKPVVGSNPVPAAMPYCDLELIDLRLVDEGLAEGDGPRYRVTIRNGAHTDFAGTMTVMLLASADGVLATDSPRAQKTAGALAVGAELTVDIRLPGNFAQHTNMFTFLTAVVQPEANVVDADPADNVATFERALIRDVPLKVMGVQSAGEGVLVVAGEGFGGSKGQVRLGAGGVMTSAETLNWRHTEVAFRLPMAEVVKHDAMMLHVVRADGRATEPVELNFKK